MDFVNAQSALNTWLSQKLGQRFVTQVPQARPARFTRTLRTGGFRRDAVTDVARITFECWAPDKITAERDAQAIRLSADTWPGLTIGGAKVHRVEEIAGPADSPDPDTAAPRYTLTLEVHFRGTLNRKER